MRRVRVCCFTPAAGHDQFSKRPGFHLGLFSSLFLASDQVLIQGFLVGCFNGHAIGACPDIAELFCRFAML